MIVSPLLSRRVRSAVLALSFGLITACSGIPDGPEVQVMPGRGRTLASFQIDDEFCREFAVARLGADGSDQAVARFAATAGAVGATLGGVIGGVLAGPRGATYGAANAARGGGEFAYGQSASSVRQKYQSRYDHAFVQCMYARGHRTPPTMAAPSTPPNVNDRLQIGVSGF